MSLREEGLRVFFKTRFQQSGIIVDEVVEYDNEFRVYVGEMAVNIDQVNELKEILSWSLAEIWAESGNLVFSYV